MLISPNNSPSSSEVFLLDRKRVTRKCGDASGVREVNKSYKIDDEPGLEGRDVPLLVKEFARNRVSFLIWNMFVSSNTLTQNKKLKNEVEPPLRLLQKRLIFSYIFFSSMARKLQTIYQITKMVFTSSTRFLYCSLIFFVFTVSLDPKC